MKTSTAELVGLLKEWLRYERRVAKIVYGASPIDNAEVVAIARMRAELADKTRQALEE